MAYVYRHIRHDKNIPFYIGIGSQDNYKRAYSNQNRNRYWHNIVNKTTYDVEIFIDEVSWEDAQKKEIEFIKIYGRNKNGGTLCNMTDGGGGSIGLITTDEAKLKQRAAKLGKPNLKLRGRKRPKHLVEQLAKINRGRPAWNKGIPITGKWKENLLKRTYDHLKGERNPNYGKPMLPQVKEALRVGNIGKVPWNKGKGGYKGTPKVAQRKVVMKYDLEMNFISEYESVQDAVANNIGTRKGCVSNCCLGRIKFHKGFIWRYKHEKPRFQGR